MYFYKIRKSRPKLNPVVPKLKNLQSRAIKSFKIHLTKQKINNNNIKNPRMCSIFDEIIVYNDLTKKEESKIKKERRTKEVEYEKPSWDKLIKTMIDKKERRKHKNINMDREEVAIKKTERDKQQ